MDEQKTIKVALAGNPNTGKTSLFNVLTGSNQHVGNWPGVTVERLEGSYDYKGYHVEVVDLPGIYGFSAYSTDERVARDFLLHHRVDLVVNVVDSTNLERNLYLNLEFAELGLPMIIALNMTDALKAKGLEIDGKVLDEYLGAPHVPISARDNTGIDDLRNRIMDCFNCEDDCAVKCKSKFSYPENIESAVKEIAGLLDEKAGIDSRYSHRWMAVELLEGEQDIVDLLSKEKWYGEVGEMVSKKVALITSCAGENARDYIVEAKYSFLKGLVKEVLKKKKDVMSAEQRLDMSDMIDRVATNSILGVPIFFLVMFLMFSATFVIGNPIASIISRLFGWLGVSSGELMTALHSPAILVSLVRDGVINGVGSVLVFLPNILVLFLVIAILEDTGYMARAAFVMDRFMHLIGLHGKSFIPMIIGFGCNVPAIMAARTLETKKDRIITIAMVPFMTCSARLPIYILFTSAFFKRDQAIIVFGIYMAGAFAGLLTAKIFKTLFFKKQEMPLIMEMPPYRRPHIKSLFMHTWHRGEQFVRKAGTVILAGVVIIWAMANLPLGVTYASENSLLGMCGRIIAPIFTTAGFASWQAGVALITGVLAKEIVVATFGAIMGTGAGLTAALHSVFTPLSAISFMVFALLYMPCLPTIAVMRTEAKWKWTVVIVSYTVIFALTAATVVYQVGRLMGFH